MAIDDEPLALQQVVTYINKVPFLELVAQCQSALEARQFLEQDTVDAIFCDINMPDLNGMDFVKSLAAPPLVVFTTAYSEYAIEGFKVNALDYLLKPISYRDFLAATDKALDYFNVLMRRNVCIRDRFMFVKSEYKLLRVRLDDILYIEGLKDYVRICLKDGEKLVSLMSMKKLDEYLPKPEFLRTHRSYIVHMPEVEAIDRFRIVFGDVFLPISDNYKDELQFYFDQHTLA